MNNMSNTNNNEQILPITEKRLRNELKELKKNKEKSFQVIQDETNILQFYFLIRGDDDDESHYKNGYYIGKIVLPTNYPYAAGDFIMLTPNGRFEINRKIYLSNTGFHNETWSSGWTLYKTLLGLISIIPDDKEKGLGHITNMSKQNRLKLAQESVGFNMINYSEIFPRFDQFVNEDGTIKSEDAQNKALEKKNKKDKKDKKNKIKEDKEDKVNNTTISFENFINEINKMTIDNYDKSLYEKVYNLINE